VVDVRRQRLVRSISLRDGGMPQDVKLSPDGRVSSTWADMASNGVWLVDADRFRRIGFVPTGRGAHGLYATGTRAGSTSRTAARDRSPSSRSERGGPVQKWRLPGGGSPDMGGVSAERPGALAVGRYNGEVYAISTRTGRLIRRMKVGAGPHGLCVVPPARPLLARPHRRVPLSLTTRVAARWIRIRRSR